MAATHASTAAPAALAFAVLLREQRLAAGLTQARLAELAGLSTRAIQHLEAGLGRPYAETARRLVDALALDSATRSAFEEAARPAPRRVARRAEHFDAFICEGGADGPVVEALVELLRDSGLRLWHERWVAGDEEDRNPPLVKLRASASCLVCVGPRGLRDWESGVVGLVLQRARQMRDARVIPVLLPGVSEPFDATTLPSPLDTQAWVDLRTGFDDQAAMLQLVAAI